MPGQMPWGTKQSLFRETSLLGSCDYEHVGSVLLNHAADMSSNEQHLCLVTLSIVQAGRRPFTPLGCGAHPCG
jgi:hypothetical protein